MQHSVIPIFLSLFRQWQGRKTASPGQMPTSPGAPPQTTTPQIVLTPAQAAAQASSRNPSHGYNLPKTQENSNDNPQRTQNATSTNNRKSIVKSWLDAFIDLIAYILARILNHPDVRDAVSTAILEGMVKLCYDEHLHDHLKHVDNTLTEHQVSDAAKKGKDAQKIVKAYLGGIFANEDKDKDKETGNEKKKDQ
mmetsp:Transcript_20779/g.57692  ORF Transcript_20779/g.57692 Transcript_20779/m.57692 type:complete len:194 (-) Transcript_20779:2282-2863(-)